MRSHGREDSTSRVDFLSLQDRGPASSSSELTSLPPTATVPCKRRHLGRRSVENRRLVLAVVLFLLLVMAEAAPFAHAVKTIPDFLSLYVAVP